ncbi:conjugal transfer protein TraG N-terminal domain-containing protein [Thermocrinis sp.]|jgi:hypothetical protein|uniref:conjugal transfer protein TraG N-terminal domain-containing protein n=1 Tax=Thermocrinis sp. TaxID=2024383 RepID=UPI003C102C75
MVELGEFTVYAWGYGDSMANALRGVALLFGHDEEEGDFGVFYGVAKIAALLGFIAVLLAYFSARATVDPLRIVKFYVVLIGVVSLFFGVSAKVQVQDEALNQTYVVRNVPYPVAYVLAFITQLEDVIAKEVDSAFGVGVHYCGSQKMGIFACSQIMAQAMDMRVVDPYLYLNLTNFFQDCVFTNILDGTLDAHTLETSNDLYGLIFSNLHPARFTVLYGQGRCSYPCNAPCGGGCSMSCVDAGAYLRTTLSQWVNAHGLNAISAAVGQTVLADLLNTVPSNIMRVRQTGTGFLMQAVLMNQFKETYRSWAASQGMGLTEQGLFTKGQIEKATAHRYLPLINGILHVLFASLIPVLVIFMLTPLMKGAIMLAFTFGLWMIVWRFAEAVVNGVFYSKLTGNFYNFLDQQQEDWGLNLFNAPVISALLVDHISLAGSLYWLVPTVSFMIASLGGYAFHSFATGLGGVVQGTAQASAGDVARGSFNAGQVNYRNVSSGNMQFGSFGWGRTEAFTESVLQRSVGNITTRGNYMQVSGGRVGDVSGVALQARANGDRAGYMAYQFTRLALGKDAQMVNFDADTRGGVLGFTAIGNDGTSISYRPGEAGTGVLTITRNGKTITTKVNSDGSIEGITTGKLSEGIVAMFGQSLAQSWAQELAYVKKDSETLSKLISQAEGIQEREDLEKFHQNVREALKQTRTEHAREVLSRIAEAVEEALKKERGFRRQLATGKEDHISSEAGASASAGVGPGGSYTVSSSGPGGKGSRSLSGSFPTQFNISTGDRYSEGQRSYNREEGTVYRDVNRSQVDKKSQEKATSDAQRKSDLDALGRSIRDGISYALRTGSFKEVGETISRALQYTQEKLESYKQTLQATNSVEFRTALLPKVFNQLKEEEAQKLQNSGLSKEEIEAKAAMNALARLDDMIEKSPKGLFKYLNSVSGLPDREGLERKVEEKTPKEGTVGNPPPELQQKIQDAENMLKGEYSLNAFVGNKRQSEALAKKLTQLTGRQAEVIKTGKGYMVSVGGFQSEDLAKGLAQGLGLKNYQVVKVQPQQHQPQQQQPPTPAKR